MRIFGKFFYRHEASTGGGGGRSYRSGSYATGEEDIRADIEVYDEIVSNIETQNAAIIDPELSYIVPDDACLLNDIIPDYEEADHQVVDLLKSLRSEGELVIASMKAIRDDIVNIDGAASQDGDFLEK